MRNITFILLLIISSSISAGNTTVRDNTTFALVGDILMCTTFPDEPRGAYMPANGGKNLFDSCRQLLQDADVAAGNLEGVFIAVGQGQAKTCYNPKSCFTFRMPTSYVTNLTDAGFDFMNIANNHANDFRNGGLASTQLTLRKAGIAYAGLMKECPTSVIVRNGKKIGFASFGHSRNTVNLNDLELVKQNVSHLDSICDIVVVTFHGGEEGVSHQHIPFATEAAFAEDRGNVYEFAHTAVDAGADIVFGHGPHVNRAMELYKDRLIMYSLGNFCTPFRMNISGVCGYAPLVWVNVDKDGSFIDGRIHPYIQVKGVGPRQDKNGVVVRKIAELTRLDFPNTPLKISSDGKLSK